MKKILLIEDDKTVARMYEKLFTYEGFECVLAHDGDSGIKTALSQAPDLILLDLMMPGKDGLKVLEELKKLSEMKDVPIIILTNFGSETLVEHAYKLGANGYLIKSEVGNERILEEVRNYIG